MIVLRGKSSRLVFTLLPVVVTLFNSASCVTIEYAEPTNALIARAATTSPEVPLPSCYPGHDCPGLWFSASTCNTTSLDNLVNTAINDAGYLANAALRALSAPHYSYFFGAGAGILSFVTTVFENVLKCIEGTQCLLSLVFCDMDNSRGYGWCPLTPDTYSYTPDGSHNTSAGGGVMYMCPAGLYLPRNPIPCSTPGGNASIGYALMRAIVQSQAITDPTNQNVTEEIEKLGIDGVTGITENGNRGIWNIKTLGWGTDGNGLMDKGIGNAENYARFASWSWDLGYGGNPWFGSSCPAHWLDFAAEEGLVPI